MLKQDRLLGDSVISTRDFGEELAKISLDLAKRENATYAELRLVNTRTEDVSVVNENPASEEASTIGVGIRVLYKDLGWGFADTDELEHDNIRGTTKKALALARGASKLEIKVTRASEPVHVDKWESPVKKDPFRVPTETKYELLQDTTKRMKEKDIVARRGQMNFAIIEKYFANYEGSKISQVLSYEGVSGIVAAQRPTGVQRRSIQQSTGGGYELIDEMDLPGQALEITKDAL